MSDIAHSRGYYGESRIAKLLGGKIVGRSKAIILDSGKVIKITHQHPVDVVTDLFGVESKYRRSCPKTLSDAYTQAKVNCPEGLIPLAVLKDNDNNRYYCILEEKDFCDLMGASTPTTPTSMPSKHARSGIELAGGVILPKGRVRRLKSHEKNQD